MQRYKVRKFTYECVVFLFCQTSALIAKTSHVPAEYPNIQSGIDVSTTGDTVLVADGTYLGDGNHDISFKGKAIVVRSENGPMFTVLDCAGSIDAPHRGVNFISGEDTLSILEGMTVKNGAGPYEDSAFLRYVGGAVYVLNSGAVIRNCVFSFNWAEFGAGATIIGPRSNVRFENCVFDHNVSMRGLGGIYFERSATIVLNNCTFTSNFGEDGPSCVGGTGRLSATKCVFVDNRGYGPSGCIALDYSVATISGCTFVGNGGFDGPTVFYFAVDSISIDHCLIAFNNCDSVIVSPNPGPLSVSCSNIYGNAGGDWTGSLTSFDTINGNVSLDPLFCNAAIRNYTLHSNSPCVANNSSCLELIGALDAGCGSTDVAFSDPESLPTRIVLSQNYPNPFNPSTTIEFELVKPERAVVRVYNAIGEVVRTMVDRQSAVGTHRVVWDGRDDQGREVASGVYLYRLTAGGVTQEKKMVLVR